MQVAATLVDVNSGKVVAQIGARHVEDDVVLGNNLAVNVHSDFGSTVKPLTDYGPAFQFLQNSTGRMILDEPYNYVGTNTPTTTGIDNIWEISLCGQHWLNREMFQQQSFLKK